MFILLIKACIVIALLFSSISAIKSAAINYIAVNKHIDSDVVYANGETRHFDSKNFGAVGKGDVTTMHLNLPEQPLIDSGTLVFYAFNTTTEVWCDGVPLNSYGSDLAEKGMMIGNHDIFVEIPYAARGGEITIILHPTENNAFSNFTNVKIYPTISAYRYFIDSDPAGFFVSLSLLVFGAMGLLACMFGKLRIVSKMNGIYLAMFSLLIALWMISNKGICRMFGFDSYFWQPLEYIAGSALAIPLVLFYRGTAYKSAKQKKFSAF